MAITKISEDDWLISDTHFGHKNIIKYCGRPKNHETVIIRNWKKLVKPTDTILHLGDITVFYGDNQEYWEEKTSELPGRKKLILGNHDGRRPTYYRNLGFSVVQPFIQKFGDVRVLFSHYPVFHTYNAKWDLNIHGHSHTHKGKKWSSWHINISIEHMKYAPVQLKDLLK